MRKSDCPMVLWDYCYERRAMIHNATASNNYLLQGQTPYYDIYGVEPDISNTCQFQWYDWVYFRDHGVSDFPLPKVKLGRVLGPAKHSGNEMAMWILKSNGRLFQGEQWGL